MLTFTTALIFFTSFLTILYLILLFFPIGRETKTCSMAVTPLLINVVDITLLFSVPLSMVLSNEKGTLFYQFFYVIISSMLIFAILLKDAKHENSKSGSLLLTATILFHITTLLNSWMTYVFPPEGIAAGEERVAAKVKLYLYGYWSQEWLFLNPTYNPFPADAGIYTVLSRISDIPITSPFMDSIFASWLIISFDIAIYILTRKITRNASTGLIAILLVALTPPLNIPAHLPRSLSILIVLVTIIFLLRDHYSRKTRLIAIILYLAAILYHLMATQTLFILIFLTILHYMFFPLSNAIRHDIPNNPNLGRYSSLILLFLCISLVKILWVEGALSQVIFPLRTLFNYMLNLQSVPETSVPNYEKFVSPINAFSWSVLPSLAAAMAIFYILNVIKGNLVKKEYLENLGLCLGGIVLLLIGFLMAISGAGFHPDIYPAMFFIVPMASMAFMKIMKSIRLGSLILILCLISASGISIRDPMLNIFSYAEMGGAADTPPKFMNWYIEGIFFATTAKPDYVLFAPYEINSYLCYVRVVNESYNYKFFGGSVEFRREVLNKVERTGDVKNGVLYIWPIWWPLGANIASHITATGRYLNVFYTSGRYTAFTNI